MVGNIKAFKKSPSRHYGGPNSEGFKKPFMGVWYHTEWNIVRNLAGRKLPGPAASPRRCTEELKPPPQREVRSCFRPCGPCSGITHINIPTRLNNGRGRPDRQYRDPKKTNKKRKRNPGAHSRKMRVCFRHGRYPFCGIEIFFTVKNSDWLKFRTDSASFVRNWAASQTESSTAVGPTANERVNLKCIAYHNVPTHTRWLSPKEYWLQNEDTCET